MTERDRHVSDLRWDRLLAGELATEMRTEIEAHAADCAQCGARLREITADREAFKVRPVGFPLQPKRRSWWGPAILAGALATTATVMLIARTPVDPSIDDGGSTKGGGVNLLLSTGQPGRLKPLAEGDVMYAGDYVQAGYTATRDGFGAVLSLDGVGTASAYVPSRGHAMVALPAGTERSFPESTVLDAGAGVEQVVVLWCEATHPLGPLLAELRATRHVTVPDGCTIRTLELVKQ